MNSRVYHIVLYCSIVLAQACSLISPRDPEVPITGSTSFLPATTPSIVIENFINAIKEQNPNSLSLCLSDTTKGSVLPYVFEPTAEVLSRYSGVFLRWDIIQERISFQSLLSKSQSDTKVSITFTNSLYDVTTPDSVVYVADYTLSTSHTIATLSTIAKGKLRFVIKPDKGGFWSIQRWSDYSIPNSDSTYTSWSNFKAQFNN